MSAFQGLNIPNIETGNLNNAKYAQMVANYLMELNENLQYMFSHIEEDNMTDQTVKNLTASYINVTNGENSMILDPDVGFKMAKGSKNQFFFNIINGDLEYSGKMTGGSIQSPNYEVDVAGMKINLDDGTLDSVGFKYDGIKCNIKGEFVSTGLHEGSAQTVTLKNGTVFATYIEQKVGNNKIYSTPYLIQLADASGYTQISSTGIYRHNFDIDGFVYLTNKNFQSSMGGVDGSFESADGKLVTVYDGVITDIS